MVFSKVNNASACIILTSATTKEVSQKVKSMKATHRIKTASCYLNDDNKVRCVAVFCPRKELPSTICDLHQSYHDYQNSLNERRAKGFNIYQRKIYLDGGNLFVDVCYHKQQSDDEFSVSLHDGTDLNNLIQAVRRNEDRELYLTDGNARWDGNRLIYSGVFSTRKYGSCDYKIAYNLDALQLYERERVLGRQGYHITTIIPTTGRLTPQFFVVFWR